MSRMFLFAADGRYHICNKVDERVAALKIITVWNINQNIESAIWIVYALDDNATKFSIHNKKSHYYLYSAYLDEIQWDGHDCDGKVYGKPIEDYPDLPTGKYWTIEFSPLPASYIDDSILTKSARKESSKKDTIKTGRL